MIPQERGIKGVLFMGINPKPTYLNLFSLCINLIIVVEGSQSKSLNSCKRVGVISHIIELLGAWG